jgi:DNA-directed RNA polymerase specialized sigma24 family protein
LDKEQISALELYELIHSKQKHELEAISLKIVSGVTLYLEMMLKLPKMDAENAAHEAFTITYERIKMGEMLDIDNLIGFLIKTARNQHLMEIRNKNKEVLPFEDELYTPPVDNLLDSLDSSEHKKVLMLCIEKLDDKQRKFVFRILRNIDDSESEHAKRFKLNVSNFRIRKYRLIHILHECVQKYLPSQI